MDTLLGGVEYVAQNMLSRYSLLASIQFIECADKQLTDIFIKQTGLKPGKNLSVTLGSHRIGLPVYEEHFSKPNEWGASYMIGRKLNLQLYVNHNWNPLTIYWKSKKGRDYRLHDTDIDCNDIEFWFENLDAELYFKQLYPNDQLPFKLKDLSYELVVNRINMDCSLNIQLKPEAVAQTDSIVEKLYGFVNDFNIKSEKKNREYGVVHNSKVTVENEDHINFELDLGSAGAAFLKKLLAFMSKMDCFEKVVVE